MLVDQTLMSVPSITVDVIMPVQILLAPTPAAVGVATTFKLMESPAVAEPHVSTIVISPMLG